MSIAHDDLELLKNVHTEFSGLISQSNQGELAQCIKLLAMYVSIYRQKFGDLPSQNYIDLMSMTELNQDMVQLITEGTVEAIEMLELVFAERISAGNENIKAPVTLHVH